MDEHSYTGKLLNQENQVITEIDTSSLPLVEVFWDDAWGDSDNLELDAVVHLVSLRRKSAGYLVDYNDERIVLTRGTIENLFRGKVFIAGVETIPWSMIKALRVVKIPELNLWK